MKFLKRFFGKILLVESVVASLVSEALVAADEPKEDVWKGVLRLQTREDCIDDESGQKFDFPRCQLRSSIGTVLELYSLISLYWLFTVSAGGTYDGLKHEAY